VVKARSNSKGTEEIRKGGLDDEETKMEVRLSESQGYRKKSIRKGKVLSSK
jgi:hypothetical protein